MRRITLLLLAVVLLAGLLPAAAQEGGQQLPASVLLTGFRHEYQGWNNCGPATLTMGLTYFGWTDNQQTAARWLKPDGEDKNVSPWQMAEFVNTFTPARALIRYGTSLDSLRLLLANDFPVLIEEGYEPEGYDWMGHYLLIVGYNRDAATFTTQDSFLGPDRVYTEDEIGTYWRHFNRLYIALYPPEREDELLALLGEDADAAVNAEHALEVAVAEAGEDRADPFAWFNIGTSLLELGRYDQAATAYDQARAIGLPWRMLWYQFGPFEAYYRAERYDDMLALAAYNLATTPDGEHPIEETYYYGGLAREALGETERARLNYQQAVLINPNFAPARESLDALDGAAGG